MTRLTNRGTTIGYIADGETDGKQRVLDKNQRTVGYISNEGTWDASYVRVADFSDAGLLLDSDSE